MPRKQIVILAILVAMKSIPVLGHGLPIFVNVTNDQLVVTGGVVDDRGYAEHIFLDGSDEAQLDHLNVPGLGFVALTNRPGLDISGMEPQSGLYLQILPHPVAGTLPETKRLLWYWNPTTEQVEIAQNEESLMIAADTASITITQEAEPVPAPLLVAAPEEEDLGEHIHFLRYLLDDDPEATRGVYGFFAQLSSPRYAASAPFLVTFANGIDSEQLMAASLAINNKLLQPGDFDLDGQLTVTDLKMLVDHFNNAASIVPYDVNGDTHVNVDDLNYWITDLKQTWMGDANLDGQFDTSDLVLTFQQGLYESNDLADWSTGDWNGDRRFNSADIIAAFQDGGYEQGQRTAVVAVPEPASLTLILFGICSLVVAQRAGQRF